MIFFLESSFFLTSNYEINQKEIIFEKSVKANSTEAHFKIFFEDDPLVLRKIIAVTNDGVVSISFNEHSYNNVFEKIFFHLCLSI